MSSSLTSFRMGEWKKVHSWCLILWCFEAIKYTHNIHIYTYVYICIYFFFLPITAFQTLEVIFDPVQWLLYQLCYSASHTIEQRRSPYWNLTKLHYAQSCQTCKKKKRAKSVYEVPEPRLLWCKWSSCSVSAPCAGVALCCVQSPPLHFKAAHERVLTHLDQSSLRENRACTQKCLSQDQSSLSHNFAPMQCNFGKVGCWNWEAGGGNVAEVGW